MLHDNNYNKIIEVAAATMEYISLVAKINRYQVFGDCNPILDKGPRGGACGWGVSNYLLSFVETAQAPNKTLLLPWHEHGHVVAVGL